MWSCSPCFCSFLPVFLLALVFFLHFFCLSPSLFLSLLLTLSFSLPFRVEGTSERSGWLSLLEADGRPKARRPQFHEAWFEHARTMSRGMPMDDGYTVCASVYVYEWACGGKMANFVGYQSEGWDLQSQPVPACFFFFLFICLFVFSTHHLCIPMHWWRQKKKLHYQWFLSVIW